MKNKLWSSAGILSVIFIACQSAPEADKASVRDQQSAAQVAGTSYAVDTTNSKVIWIGTKPTGQHTGTFQLKEGAVVIDGEELKGGTFTIDVTSLNTTDLQGEGKMKLDGHLKSADFFDAGKYPVSQFVITGIERFDSLKNTSLLPGATHLVSGNLTLKDSTKNITFPAKIKWQGNTLSTQANFNIDRTQWGMFYGSDASIQDNFIRPDVNIQLNLKAMK